MDIFFNDNVDALVQVDHRLMVTRANNSAVNLGIEHNLPCSISDIFPDFQSLNHTQIITLAAKGKNMPVLLDPLVQSDTSIYRLTLAEQVSSKFDSNKDIQEQIKYREMFRKQHQSINRLAKCKTINELYKNAINDIITEFGIDRAGLLILDEAQNMVRGTYGTDINGNLCDESDYQAPFPLSQWMGDVLFEPHFFSIWQDVDLFQYGKKVGKGWSAMAVLSIKDKVVGWLALDNLINRHPIEEYQKEIIILFTDSLSLLITRLDSLENHQQLNDNLESKVLQQTYDLSKQEEQLIQTQNELIETAKLAQLGELVAGVSHEINTPLGTAMTANSLISDLGVSINRKFEERRLTKADLSSFLKESNDAASLLLTSLFRAADLIKSFKQLAVEQSTNKLLPTNIHELMNHIINSHHHLTSTHLVKINNLIEYGTTIETYSSIISQIITSLISNSVHHGFDQQSDGGTIDISCELKSDYWQLIYRDNGKGIPDLNELNKIFNPFYSTKKSEKFSGLGLNLVYSLVTKSLKGTINVENAQPSGLTFLITIPHIDQNS